MDIGPPMTDGGRRKRTARAAWTRPPQQEPAHGNEEPPFIAAERRLVPGMVPSQEQPYNPSIVGAFRLERIVLLAADGRETLDHSPFPCAIR